MPVPVPSKGESQDKFISRCISALHHADPDRDDKQIQAMCYSQWRKKKGEDMDSTNTLRETVRFSVPVKIEEAKTDSNRNTYIIGNAVDVGVSRNNVHYSAEELEKSSHTLIGKPLLLNHADEDVRNIVGKVVQAGFDGKNVPFKAVIDEGEEAIIRKLKNGFVSSVSIGASYDDPLEIDESGIAHPKNLEFLELSLVTIPGVANATISQVINEKYKEKKTMQETVEDLKRQLAEVTKEKDSLLNRVKEQDEAESESSEKEKPAEEPKEEEPSKETEALRKTVEKLTESVSRLEKERSKSVVIAEKSAPNAIEMVHERNDKGLGIDFYPKGIVTATSREAIVKMAKEFY